MQIKIPLVNSRIENDLLIVLLLTPLWWFLGLNFFIYHLTVLFVFLKLFGATIIQDRPFKIPKAALCFSLFLLLYLTSIVFNASLRPAQRVFASLNNYFSMIMGFMLMVLVYNCEEKFFFKKFLKTSRNLGLITGLLAIVFLVLWSMGYKDMEMESFLARIFPRLLEYPYFNNLLLMTGTFTEYYPHFEFPRLTLYTNLTPTAVGGFMVMLVPLMMAYYEIERRSLVERALVLSLGLIALFFSLSRAAIYGFGTALFFVNVVQRGKKVVFAFFFALIILISVGMLQDAITWILDFRKSSSVGRLGLYVEALQIVLDQNLLIGMGILMRNEFTMTSIGSHSSYVEFLFVTGILGLSAFIFFQGIMTVVWISLKDSMKKDEHKIAWKYLGVSFIGANIWLFTDTLIALPFIPYVYFMIAGGILLLTKSARAPFMDRGEMPIKNLQPVGRK